MGNDTALSALLDLAISVSRQAGDMVAATFSTPGQVWPKGDNDFVTEADFKSQSLIVDLIRREHPSHGFLVEESSPDVPSPQQYTWVVDPIDGTVNYIRARPIFCVSLGLMIDNAPRLGVIYDPIHKEMFAAASERGCYLNGSLLNATSKVERLHDAAIGTDWDTSPTSRQNDSQAVARLLPNVQTLPTFGSVALALAWVASGRIDGYFKFEAHAWDIAAAAVLIQEAGGRLTHHNNQAWNWRSDDKSVIASNGVLHESLRAYLT